jgi:hypothetical protein
MSPPAQSGHSTAEHDVDGWAVWALAGWYPWPSGPDDLTVVPAGEFFELPRTFSLVARAPDDEFTVALHFAVEGVGQIRLAQALAIGDIGLLPALDRLRETRPLEVWMRQALVILINAQLQGATWAEAVETGKDLLAEAESGGNPGPWLDHATAIIRRNGPGLVAAVQEANGAQLRKTRRHNKITDEHLAEVARVYKAADSKGDPPRIAVAEHFKTSPTSAARWVGMARKKGFLPPAGRQNAPS